MRDIDYGIKKCKINITGVPKGAKQIEWASGYCPLFEVIMTVNSPK